jgi:hypothetical protein
MRSLRTVLLVALASAPAGCEWMRGGRDKETAPRPTGQAVPPAETAQLLAYLNRQADTLRSVSYGDVVLSATEAGRDYPTLRDCKLAAAQPRNFRLVCGTLVTSQELDLGSNDREFWMYAKRLDGPNFFYCSHTDFDKPGVAFPIPFDPDWVMSALGMTKYDPAGQYTVDVNTREGAYVLRQKTTTRQGQPITRVTVFNADYQQGKRPVVRGLIVQDEAGRRVCSAEVKAVKTVTRDQNPAVAPAGFVQIPTHVVLEWPQQKFVMDLRLSDEAINEDLSGRSAALFSRPQIRGTNPIDLARHQFVQPSSSRGQAPGEVRSRRR